MPSSFTCLAVIWSGWLVSWLLAARWTAKTVARQSISSRLAQSGLLWGGAALLFLRPTGSGFLTRSPYPLAAWVGWSGVALTVLGLGFTGWARVHLGRFWSGAVTLKAEHALVRSGPYALTRHPIYTGLLLAMTGTALARNSVAAIVGLGLFAVGVVLKVRQEEGLLTEHFGAAYRVYRAEVPGLVPGLW